MTNKDMDKTDDEILSSYIDGELSRDEADALTERLANEPALMQRLEALRSADSAVRDVYAAIDDAPLPDAVLDLFEQKPSEDTADNVVAFPVRGFRQFLQAPVAIAASVALIAGVLLADIFRQGTIPAFDEVSLVAGTIDAQSGLHDLLENSASGVPRDLGNGATAELVLSFEDSSGDFCRQLAVSETGRSAHGVACRRGDAWQLEVVAYGVPASPTGQFTMAAGAIPEAVTTAVDGLIGAGETLDREQEILIISEGWEKPVN